MTTGNQSLGTDFVLVGLFHYGRMNALLFAAVVTLFWVAVLGNVTLAHPIRADSRLHTPMHLLLGQLSLIDMLYISTAVPKAATSYLTDTKAISFWGCEMQTLAFLILGGSEAILRGFVSYDRYVATCRPLRYPVLMSRKIGGCLVTCAWSGSAANSLIPTLYVFQLPFCGSRLVNHCFCELPSRLPLVCQDTSQYEYTILLSGLVILLLPFLGILASYAQVLTAVLRMRSRTGQTKALSTCSSHLTVASLFYVATLSTCTRPHSLRDPAQDKVVAVFYTIITPLLNPFIYSLRNKEVLGALRKLGMMNIGRDHVALGIP
ncbi:PREDICTED: olfactory receptor 2AK2-like [Chinchilla lanigera]|uniref:olfactory receptor 2AK2-like n=1 Tax=Chinchilla lanigera TaxID=34839 RepID=UPI00038EAA34|nr:PREDICTED: olfactory receptor 2AK2-like [Chinchilla lanigera]